MRTKKPYELAMLPQATLHSMLSDFTRDQLRTLANNNGIKRGRSKADTLRNLTDPAGLVALKQNGVTVTFNG